MTRFHTLLALITVGATACSSGDAGQQIPLAQASTATPSAQEAHALIGPEARAALDSGNVLFRSKSYTAALARYRDAADLAPQHAAPIFGMYMVAKAMNNTKLADSTLAEIRKRNGPLPETQHEFSDSALKALHKQVGPAGTKGL